MPCTLVISSTKWWDKEHTKVFGYSYKSGCNGKPFSSPDMDMKTGKIVCCHCGKELEMPKKKDK